MQVDHYELLLCHAMDGSVPLEEWIGSLDVATRGRVRIRIDRLEDGNSGDAKSAGGGVLELRLEFGPGYRIYFGIRGREVHLISGGTKSTQAKDILSAQSFWRNHE